MQPVDRRKFYKALSQACRKAGLELDKESKAGSHEGWIIRDKATGERLTLVLTSHPDISPGVMRRVKTYALDMGAKVAIGVVVHEILDRLTGN